MHRMVTAPIPLYSPNNITRAQSRAGGWIASFDFDGACTSTPSLPAIGSPNESLDDSSTTTSTLTGPFCCNHQYSVTAITTSTGAVAERYAYTAYGQPTILNAAGTPLSPQTSTLNSRYSYTGREWDATLGLHHFRARWMSPIAGRFLTRDPIGYRAGDANVFRFVGGDPLNAIDPTGLKCNYWVLLADYYNIEEGLDPKHVDPEFDQCDRMAPVCCWIKKGKKICRTKYPDIKDPFIPNWPEFGNNPINTADPIEAKRKAAIEFLLNLFKYVIPRSMAQGCKDNKCDCKTFKATIVCDNYAKKIIMPPLVSDPANPDPNLLPHNPCGRTYEWDCEGGAWSDPNGSPTSPLPSSNGPTR